LIKNTVSDLCPVHVDLVRILFLSCPAGALGGPMQTLFFFLVALGAFVSAWIGDLLGANAAESASPKYQLEEIIDLALERNPAVLGAEGFVQHNRGNQISAGAYPNPSITGNGGRGVLRETGRLAPTAVLEPAPTALTEYNGMVAQPLEWPAKRAARMRAADAGLAGADAGLAETRLNLVADVKVAFYELLVAQRDLELARQNLTVVEGVQRIVRARVRLGEAPQFEAIKAEVEVLKANQAVTRAENTVLVTRVVLDTLTAGALGLDYAIRGDFEKFRRDLTLEMLITQALGEHPAIRRLNRLVERADYNLEFERQARVPNFTVNGNYVREVGREAFLAGVSVPTPIWYQRQGEIAAALGAKRQEEAELLRTRNVLLKEVNQYFQEAQTTANLIDVFEKGLLKQAQEALRIAQFSFQQGETSLLEVLDAQRVQRQILQDYAYARFDLSRALARLERAVGGPLSRG
jgi:cobalt-zinc-cadmium efflux system outer membrane protein